MPDPDLDDLISGLTDEPSAEPSAEQPDPSLMVEAPDMGTPMLTEGPTGGPSAEPASAEPEKPKLGRKKAKTVVEDTPLTMMPSSERVPDERTLLEMRVGAATLRRNQGG